MQVPVTKEILELIRTYAHREGISLSEFARRAKISKAWLSRLKNHDANLSLETATYLLDVVGYRLSVQKKGGSTASVSKTKEVTAKRSRLRKVVECQNM